MCMKVCAHTGFRDFLEAQPHKLHKAQPTTKQGGVVAAAGRARQHLPPHLQPLHIGQAQACSTQCIHTKHQQGSTAKQSNCHTVTWSHTHTATLTAFPHGQTYALPHTHCHTPRSIVPCPHANAPLPAATPERSAASHPLPLPLPLPNTYTQTHAQTHTHTHTHCFTTWLDSCIASHALPHTTQHCALSHANASVDGWRLAGGASL